MVVTRALRILENRFLAFQRRLTATKMIAAIREEYAAFAARSARIAGAVGVVVVVAATVPVALAAVATIWRGLRLTTLGGSASCTLPHHHSDVRRSDQSATIGHVY